MRTIIFTLDLWPIYQRSTTYVVPVAIFLLKKPSFDLNFGLWVGLTSRAAVVGFQVSVWQKMPSDEDVFLQFGALDAAAQLDPTK